MLTVLMYCVYMICIDERLDVVEDVECVQVGYGECVDEWLEVIEDVDCMQVDDVDYVDDRLEEIEDVNCVHIDDVDYVRMMKLEEMRLMLKAGWM